MGVEKLSDIHNIIQGLGVRVKSEVKEVRNSEGVDYTLVKVRK